MPLDAARVSGPPAEYLLKLMKSSFMSEARLVT